MAMADTGLTGCCFRLYVAGNAPNSARARSNLEKLIAEHFDGGCEVEIVDILEAPERALAEGVLVSPMLVRTLPKPVVRVVGDLSRAERVLAVLGLSTGNEGTEDE